MDGRLNPSLCDDSSPFTGHAFARLSLAAHVPSTGRREGADAPGRAALQPFSVSVSVPYLRCPDTTYVAYVMKKVIGSYSIVPPNNGKTAYESVIEGEDRYDRSKVRRRMVISGAKS